MGDVAHACINIQQVAEEEEEGINDNIRDIRERNVTTRSEI